MFYKFAIFHIHTFTLSHLQTFTLSKFHTITLVNKLGVQCTPGPIHVGPFGKCSLWDDYTSGHSAAAPLVAGGLWAYLINLQFFHIHTITLADFHTIKISNYHSGEQTWGTMHIWSNTRRALREMFTLG